MWRSCYIHKPVASVLAVGQRGNNTGILPSRKFSVEGQNSSVEQEIDKPKARTINFTEFSKHLLSILRTGHV